MPGERVLVGGLVGGLPDFDAPRFEPAAAFPSGRRLRSCRVRSNEVLADFRGSHGHKALFRECVTRFQIRDCEHTAMNRIYHPLLALIASATESELAKYVEYLKAENRILRARLPKQVHTRPEERLRLLKLGKAIGRAIEELITIRVSGDVLPLGT